MLIVVIANISHNISLIVSHVIPIIHAFYTYLYNLSLFLFFIIRFKFEIVLINEM